MSCSRMMKTNFFLLFTFSSKQNWLWDEGEHYRKKRSIVNTAVHTYGIYSIKKIKLNTNNAVNRNSLQLFKKNSVLKDRVQKTSRKLDNMKLTDDAPKNALKKQNKLVATPVKNDNCSITDNSEVLNALLLHHEQTNVSALNKNSLRNSESGFSLKADSRCRNENKNSPNVEVKDDISSQVVNDLKSIKLISHRDEENNRIKRVSVAHEETGETLGTQGDQLNKIKAMRRRHSRSVNVSTSL